MRTLLFILAIVGIGFIVYGEWLDSARIITIHNDNGRIEVTGGAHVVPPTAQARPTTSDASVFRCDGRQHCSQMRSCEEATYVVRHCPNVKMDGDGDGVPCETQWCRW